MPAAINNNVLLFLEKYGGNRAERELLIFWSRHPNARFTRTAVFYAIDCNRYELEKALREQIEVKLVDVSMEHGQAFYSLTGDKERRQPVLDIAGLEFAQWQGLLVSLEKITRDGNRVAKQNIPAGESLTCYKANCFPVGLQLGLPQCYIKSRSVSYLP